MKISILSDLHIDFHIPQKDPNRIKDQAVYQTFKEYLDDSIDVEVLVIAGDIGHYHKQSFVVLEAIARIFNYKKLFIVSGNHELYRSTHHTTLERITSFWDYESDVISVLNGNIVEYKGVTFGGTMGWAYGLPYMQKVLGMGVTTEQSIAIYEDGMNDMHYIDGLRNPKDMYDVEYEKLLDTYGKCDVMITHYAPTIRQEEVELRFQMDPITGFYVMDTEDLVRKSSAEVWIHGHIHRRNNYRVGSCEVVANPLGYPGEMTGAKRLTIEV